MSKNTFSGSLIRIMSRPMSSEISNLNHTSYRNKTPRNSERSPRSRRSLMPESLNVSTNPVVRSLVSCRHVRFMPAPYESCVDNPAAPHVPSKSPIVQHTSYAPMTKSLIPRTRVLEVRNPSDPPPRQTNAHTHQNKSDTQKTCPSSRTKTPHYKLQTSYSFTVTVFTSV